MEFAKLPDLRAASAPDAPCIADVDTSLSNADFLARVRQAAGVFSRHAIEPGDVVALMLPNCADFVVAMFAAWRLGAAIMPINPAASVAEATHQLSDSDARLLVTADGRAIVPTVAALACGALQEGAALDAPAVIDPAALALLIYTSGTTGKPKGVMLDHANIDAMTQMGVGALQLGPSDHCLLVLPLFHVNGIVVSILSTFSQGGRVTIRKRFDIETFFSDVEAIRPTFVSAVPTIYTMLNALPADVRPDTSSLRFGVCGAAPASAELLTTFEARYGFPIVEAYGLSEGTCGSTINPIDGVRKAGTVGLALPGQRIAIADPQGRHLPPGETGEVLIQGGNVMRGYLGRPEETARVIVAGWLHTGDLGRIDEDGYLSIVGRLKEMIIRGGENIYPREIEDVLYECADVQEAAVVGAPDAKFGEIVVAHVTLRANGKATPSDLARHCADRLTRHKWPAAIHIHASLPKNAVGKIDKLALRARAAEPAQ